MHVVKLDEQAGEEICEGRRVNRRMAKRNDGRLCGTMWLCGLQPAANVWWGLQDAWRQVGSIGCW